jgi:hypothetical protein
MKNITILLIILMVICFGLLTGCISDYDSDILYNEHKSYLVRYEVTGTADSVSVTYENNDGGVSQESNVEVPWSCPTVFCPSKSGDFVYISAQNNGEYGSVKTTIYVDGEVFKTSTSYGAYVIASSSGSLP